MTEQTVCDWCKKVITGCTGITINTYQTSGTYGSSSHSWSRKGVKDMCQECEEKLKTVVTVGISKENES